MNENVRQTLLENIRKERIPRQQCLMSARSLCIENVIFEEIDELLVQKTDKGLSGSSGPPRIDSEVWKHLLCSRAFRNLSDELANAIAVMAGYLCTDAIPFDHLHLLLNCRLISQERREWCEAHRHRGNIAQDHRQMHCESTWTRYSTRC